MDDDDDLFDDADLLAIEARALAATQQPASPPEQRPASRGSDYGFDNDDDVVNLVEESERPIHQSRPQYKSHIKPIPHPQKHSQTWHSSQQSIANVPAAGWYQTTVPTRSSQPVPRVQQRSTTIRSKPDVAAREKAYVSATHTGDRSRDDTSLLARIAELEKEHERLRKTAEDAKSALYAKTGEISIVRSNHEKATKDFERRIAILQKTHAEEAAKQQAELDAAKNDVQKSKTDQTFLEHDLKLAQEVRRRARRDPPQGQTTTTSTPRKARTATYRDGFDDDEVFITTPSKSRDRRRKDDTPRAHGKRKRTDSQHQSPTKPLPLSGPTSFEDALQLDPMHVDGDLAPVGLETNRGTNPERLHELGQAKGKLEFMRFVLDHKVLMATERTIERLTRYNFPPNKSTTMASRVYDLFASATAPTGALAFKASLCEVLMDMWSQTFDDGKLPPLKVIVELLHDILLNSESALSTELIPRIVTLGVTATDHISLKLIRAYKDPKRNELPSSNLIDDLQPLDYLDLIETVALHNVPIRTDNEAPLMKFWAATPLETILMLLHKVQPLEQIHALLLLLQSSILKDSFGSRAHEDALRAQEDRDRQWKNEDSLLKRLTVLLFEKPLSLDPAVSYTVSDCLALRGAILTFLDRLAVHSHGGQAMVDHNLVIGRLARFIHECVISVYAYNPATHDMTVGLLNRAVKLLSYLTSKYNQAFDLRAKLAAVSGSEHMHLVALSRIAFAEGHSVIERGIEPEVAEAAHRMLDEHLSPDEGEAVMEVFSTAKSWNDA